MHGKHHYQRSITARGAGRGLGRGGREKGKEQSGAWAEALKRTYTSRFSPNLKPIEDELMPSGRFKRGATSFATSYCEGMLKGVDAVYATLYVRSLRGYEA